MKCYESDSYEATLAVAADLARTVPKGTVIALRGGLGAGKTAFTTGFVQGLGIDCDVSSPTFALVNEYRSTQCTLYHFDMYRVTGWEDLYSTGFFDYLDSGAYLCIEWSENIDGALPDDTLYVEILPDDGDRRIIKVWRRGESD